VGAWPVGIVALSALGAGCSFELSVTIAMDQSYGSLEDDGKRAAYVTVERSYGSIDEAQTTDLAFEVSDGAGAHSFDLSQYVFCDNDPDPQALEVSLLLTYSVTCMPEAPEAGDTLRLCWTGSRCNETLLLP
jgi:hypothetical protein